MYPRSQPSNKLQQAYFKSKKEKACICKGFTAFNIIPHILKAAVPTPTKEAPVQAFRAFHFFNCSPLNANASKKQPFLG